MIVYKSCHYLVLHKARGMEHELGFAKKTLKEIVLVNEGRMIGQNISKKLLNYSA